MMMRKGIQRKARRVTNAWGDVRNFVEKYFKIKPKIKIRKN